MSEKFYTERDVSEHSIMLTGLPKDIPQKDLENMLRKIFVELLENESIDESQILQIRVSKDMHKCHKWINKIKIY